MRASPIPDLREGNAVAILLQIPAYKKQRSTGFAKIGKIRRGKLKVAGIPLAQISESEKLRTKQIRSLIHGHWAYSGAD